MQTQYACSEAHLDNQGTTPKSRVAGSALLVFENDLYAGLGFPAQTVLLGTVAANVEEDVVMAVTDGARFWLGKLSPLDCAHVIITALGRSIVLPSEHLTLFKLHKKAGESMN